MSTVDRTRDVISFALATTSCYAVYYEKNDLMMFMPYLFVPFFIADFVIVDTIFRVHHTIASVISVFFIFAQKPHPMVNAIYATEYSTPLWFAIYYLPNPYKKVLKPIFVILFYIHRVQNYALQLNATNVYEYYPHPTTIILTTSLYSLFALNFVWFGVMFYRSSYLVKAAFLCFVCSYNYINYM